MYVDKRLSGLQCVQTLSRLNRTINGKNDTFVLDFVNEPDMIRDSFKDYYEGTILSEETDPNRLYFIEQEVKKFNLFTDDLVEKFVDNGKNYRLGDIIKAKETNTPAFNSVRNLTITILADPDYYSPGA